MTELCYLYDLEHLQNENMVHRNVLGDILGPDELAPVLSSWYNLVRCDGSVVKWSRRRPLKAKTGVRLSSESPHSLRIFLRAF